MTRQEFIFSRQYPVRLYRHVVFWVALYSFSVLTYFHDFLEKIGLAKWMLLEAGENVFHVTTQMIFCYGVLYMLVPVFFNRKRYIAFVCSLVVFSTAVYFLYYFEHDIFFRKLHGYVGLPFRTPALIYWFTLISFFTYFPISTSLALAIKMLKNWYSKQLENQLLVRENANAELQLLKAQIHPHFLFNTLNNIYSFTLDKSPRSPALVKKLSATLNYMIHECEAPLVPLKKEIAMINDYMELEKVRYGSRLKMEIAIQGSLENKMITPLLLIPFIENSFKHGTSQMLQRPWIKLSINVDDDSLSFRLSNSKPSTTSVPSVKSGIGLTNVKKRLALIYPMRYQLDIEAATDDFSVAMKIPVALLHTAEQKEEKKTGSYGTLKI